MRTSPRPRGAGGQKTHGLEDGSAPGKGFIDGIEREVGVSSAGKQKPSPGFITVIKGGKGSTPPRRAPPASPLVPHK